MILGETEIFGISPKSVMPEDDSAQDLKICGLSRVKKAACIRIESNAGSSFIVLFLQSAILFRASRILVLAVAAAAATAGAAFSGFLPFDDRSDTESHDDCQNEQYD